MKQSGTCPRCGGRRIGHLPTVQDLSDASRRLSNPVPRMIAVARETRKGWLGDKQYEALAGEVEAFVCTSCGYFEEYVKRPEAIAWEDLVDFEWYEGPPRA